MPIPLRLGTRRRSDDLQHPLGGVLIRTAGGGSVLLKVACERPGVLANVAKVDGFAAVG